MIWFNDKVSMPQPFKYAKYNLGYEISYFETLIVVYTLSFNMPTYIILVSNYN